MFKVEQLAVGGYDDNFSYLIVAPDQSGVLVDPTGDINIIANAVKSYPHLQPKYILLTHTHPDHIAGVEAVKSFFEAPVCGHVEGKFPLTHPLEDGEKLPLDSGYIEAIFTPGHSPDSICYRLSDNSGLFTGDTLFVGCCGFCRPERMFNSLQKLKTLDDKLIIYSGHNYGETPFATLGAQRITNPYLNTDDLREFKHRLKDLH